MRSVIFAGGSIRDFKKHLTPPRPSYIIFQYYVYFIIHIVIRSDFMVKLKKVLFALFATVFATLVAVGFAGCFGGSNDPEGRIEQNVMLDGGVALTYDAELEGYVVVDFGNYSEDYMYMEQGLIEIIEEYQGVPVKAVTATLPRDAREIYIPNSVVQLGPSLKGAEWWLQDNPELENIIVGDENPRFISCDRILYEKDGDDLNFVYVCVRNGESAGLYIPEGVKQVNEMLGVRNLRRISNLIDLRLSDSVTQVDPNAFSWYGYLSDNYIVEIGSGLEAESIQRLFAKVQPKGGRVRVAEGSNNPNVSAQGGITYLNLPDDGKKMLSWDGPFSSDLVFPDNCGLTNSILEYIVAYNKDVIENIVLPVEITELRDYPFMDDTKLKSISGAGVTKLGSRTFSGCKALESVSFPLVGTVKDGVGDNVFNGCTALKNVDLPKLDVVGNNMFYHCTSLESIDLPELSYVGYCMFYDCEALKQVNAPQATSVGINGFNGCRGLESLDLPNVESISGTAFGRCTALKTVNLSSVKTCDASAFGSTNNSITDLTISVKVYDLTTNFTALKNLTVLPVADKTLAYGPTKTPTATKIIYGEGITEIRGVQAENAAVEEVELPSTVKVLDEYAFNNCKSLPTIDLKNVESIGNFAFINCEQFEGIGFPATVSSVGYNAFNGCQALGNVRFAGDVSIGSGVFEDCYYITYVTFGGKADIGSGAFGGCTALETVTLGGDTKIRSYAFDECRKLSEIDFSKVTEIGDYAFRSCSSLTAVSFGKIQKLEDGAFVQCSALTAADLTGIKSIGNYAFGYCNNLTNVTVDDDMYNIGIDAFIDTAFLNNAETRNGAKYVKTYLLKYLGTGIVQADTPYVVEDGTTLIAGESLGNAYSVILPASLKYISDYAFRYYPADSITIPDGVEYIGYQAFFNTELKNVTIPGSVKRIGDCAFESSYKIENVIISEGVQEIGNYAFESSYAYTQYRKNIALPASVVKIGEGAFYSNDFSKIKVYYAGTSDQWNAIEKGSSHLTDTYLPMPTLGNALNVVDDGNYTLYTDGATYKYADGRVEIITNNNRTAFKPEGQFMQGYRFIADGSTVVWDKLTVHTDYATLCLMKRDNWATFFNGDEFVLTFTDDGVKFVAPKAVDMGVYDVTERTITATEDGYLYSFKIDAIDEIYEYTANIYAIGETTTVTPTTNPIDLYFLAIDYYKNFTQRNETSVSVDGYEMQTNYTYEVANNGNRMKLTSYSSAEGSPYTVIQWVDFDGTNYKMYQDVDGNIRSGTVTKEKFDAMMAGTVSGDTRWQLYVGDNYTANGDGTYTYTGEPVYMEYGGETIEMSDITLTIDGGVLTISGTIGGVMNWSYRFSNVNTTTVTLPSA